MSVLNMKDDRYLVGNCADINYIFVNETPTVDSGKKHLHKSLLIVHKLRKQTLPSS